MKWILIILAVTLLGLSARTPLKIGEPCTPVIYALPETQPKMYDMVVIEFMVKEYYRRGYCVNAFYISPDPESEALNIILMEDEL